MKKALMVVMAVGLFGAVSARADHIKSGAAAHQDVRQCALEAETIQQKIKRLNTEIKKGTRVYSVDEIKRLEDTLKEANELLDNLGKR